MDMITTGLLLTIEAESSALRYGCAFNENTRGLSRCRQFGPTGLGGSPRCFFALRVECGNSFPLFSYTADGKEWHIPY
jgi:hypothetical protein